MCSTRLAQWQPQARCLSSKSYSWAASKYFLREHTGQWKGKREDVQNRGGTAVKWARKAQDGAECYPMDLRISGQGRAGE